LSNASPEPLPLVRPYALTGGRTKPKRDYPLEALVKTDVDLEPGRFRSPEESAIAELCAESRSVAEVAALIKLPLGVVRVLISDLADRGVVQVHTQTSTDDDSRPDAALLERVLSGLRNL
jgi:nucleoside phosphorylase